jgi:hypothetical protein
MLKYIYTQIVVYSVGEIVRRPYTKLSVKL